MLHPAALLSPPINCRQANLGSSRTYYDTVATAVKMLASQMASVSQVTKSSFLLQATIAPSTAIARSTRLPRRSRHQQQVRSFRIGLWSSYLDPAFQKELQRRHRVIKHKYAEALNRKLSWDRRLPLYATRWGLKGLMCSSWRAHDPRPGGRWVNVDEVREVKGESNTTSSCGIEEVEQEALNELFSRKDVYKSVYRDGSFGWNWVATDSTSAPLVGTRYRKAREPWTDREPISRHDRQQFGKAETSLDEQEYVIDPITNRKVFGKSKPQPETKLRDSDSPVTEIPVKTFKGYRSQFSQFEPPVEKVERKAIHLDGGDVYSVSQTGESAIQDVPNEVNKYKPFKYNEPDGKSQDQGDAATNKLREHDHLYKPFRYYEPNGKSPDQGDVATDKLREHDHLYKPFRYNEPDGKSPDQGDAATDKLREHDHLYKPFRYNEPDGKSPDQGDAATDKLREHDHLYKPFRYNEPDGKFPEKPDCVSECLSDFDHPYKPFKYNEPDGKLPEQSNPVEKGLKDYDHQAGLESQQNTASRPAIIDGQQYNSVDVSAQGSWNSQEGFPSNAGLGRGKRAAAQPRKQSQDAIIEPSLDRTLQSRSSNLDQVTADKREDLDSLRASDIRAASGMLNAQRKETQAEKDRRRTALETDFDKIQTRASSLEEEIAATLKVKESRQLVQDLELERSYLLNHNAHARGRVNAKIAELDTEMAAGKAHSDAQKKVAGNFVRDFPEEFSASWSTKGSSANSCLVPKNNTDAWGYDKSPQGLEVSYQQEMENEVQCAENDYATDIASKDSSDSAKIGTALQRRLRVSENKAQAEHDPYTKEPQGLETSYAEEAQEEGNCGSPLFVKSYGCEKKAQQDNDLVRDIRSIYESTYGTIDCNHRQILKNQREPQAFEQKDEDTGMQRHIQNLEHIVRESQYQVHERYMDVAKILAKQVPLGEQGAVSTGETSSVLNEPPAVASSPEPTLYKILAYDPIMQTIKMAETTSFASDTSSALTPAEVLLRLSNPAKFFPHFQPLQSQGYEIASGSGDVLVFRKVREDIPIAGIQSGAAPAASSVPHGRKVVNPIDGMQSVPQPATGNFASPTGFVNHDLPSDHPFISGIDVRREEPVFSGRRAEWQDGDDVKEEPGRTSKKFGRGLLVGAAWVAACSYAVGVVAEFFKTGGTDGKGPVGF
jgi:hypothetical protein